MVGPKRHRNLQAPICCLREIRDGHESDSSPESSPEPFVVSVFAALLSYFDKLLAR